MYKILTFNDNFKIIRFVNVVLRLTVCCWVVLFGYESVFIQGMIVTYHWNQYDEERLKKFVLPSFCNATKIIKLPTTPSLLVVEE